MDSRKISPDGNAEVTFTVKNSGKRDGDVVGQVYFRHLHSKVPQPKLALCGFERVHLNPGNQNRDGRGSGQTIALLGHAEKAILVEPGNYEFLVGAASDDVQLKLPATVVAN